METFGTSDCERIRLGFLSQPVNALSSLGFLPAGLAIARRRRDRMGLALATASVGVGSFLAHGPRWRASQWTHDVTIAWVLTEILLDRKRRSLRLLAHGVLGVLFAVAPRSANPVSASLAALGIGREVSSPQRRQPGTVRALLLAGLGTLIGRSTATGRALCDPDSLLQGHAAWHLLAASSLAVWGSTAPR